MEYAGWWLCDFKVKQPSCVVTTVMGFCNIYMFYIWFLFWCQVTASMCMHIQADISASKTSIETTFILLLLAYRQFLLYHFITLQRLFLNQNVKQ